MTRVEEVIGLSKKIDQRDILKDCPFEYQISKGKILIEHYGKLIMVVSGKKSAKVIPQLEDADEFDEQLILAKLTGNFKRGNERMSKNSKKYRY